MYQSNPPSLEVSSSSIPPWASVRDEDEKGSVPLTLSKSYYADTLSSKSDEKPKERVPWSSGLFDCLSDRRNCLITCVCPCITFGQIAEIVDKGSSACGVNGALYTLITCVTFCPFFYSCFYRAKMRQQYLLKKNPCGDWLLHTFCECCALCQEYRELKKRGFDLAIGWHGNVEEKQRMLEMSTSPPLVEDGMNRYPNN